MHNFFFYHRLLTKSDKNGHFWTILGTFFYFYRRSLVLNHFDILSKNDKIWQKSLKFSFFCFIDVFFWNTGSKKLQKMTKCHVFYNEMAFFTLDFWPKMVGFFGFYHILDFYRCSLVLNHLDILTKYDKNHQNFHFSFFSTSSS